MKIEIQEPWWSCWQKFNWAKGIWGIGLSVEDVDLAIENREPLIINIHGFKEKYKISPVTVRNYALKHHTVYTAKFNKKLYIVPQTELKKCK